MLVNQVHYIHFNAQPIVVTLPARDTGGGAAGEEWPMYNTTTKLGTEAYVATANTIYPDNVQENSPAWVRLLRKAWHANRR